ncbi:MAG: type II 3-dehydroquinate dehydratase [Gammaproteobacteria bacterium]|jgi:3-dehydroquinate dehydratase II
MANLLVIHGPNLNLLGEREPDHYGYEKLEDINRRLESIARAAGHSLECFQSNAEHALVERIQSARHECIAFIIINAAAYTHTSIALRDALAAVAIPFVEVHLSNVYRREPFRHRSYLSDIALGVVAGLGPLSYECALRAILGMLDRASP